MIDSPFKALAAVALPASLIACSALLLGACGDDDDDGGSTLAPAPVNETSGWTQIPGPDEYIDVFVKEAEIGGDTCKLSVVVSYDDQMGGGIDCDDTDMGAGE